MTTKPKLTVLDHELEERIARTQPGMAFWCGTGPKGTTCRECVFYTFEGYKSSRGRKGGLLKSGRCKKFTAMAATDGPHISFELSSCKFFDRNPTPPSITDPRK